MDKSNVDKISNCDKYSKSIYSTFSSAYIGVHKVVSVEHVLSIGFKTIPSNEPLY